jgi:hypothetical protein
MALGLVSGGILIHLSKPTHMRACAHTRTTRTNMHTESSEGVIAPFLVRFAKRTGSEPLQALDPAWDLLGLL